MKQETEKPLDEQRRIVTDLDGLPPYRDLRQAKVNALPALRLSRCGGVSRKRFVTVPSVLPIGNNFHPDQPGSQPSHRLFHKARVLLSRQRLSFSQILL